MEKLRISELKSMIADYVWSFTYSHAVVNREIIDGNEQVAGWVAVESIPCDSKLKFKLTHIKWFDCTDINTGELTLSEADHPWQVSGVILTDEAGNKLNYEAAYEALNDALKDTMHVEVSTSVLDTCKHAA